MINQKAYELPDHGCTVATVCEKNGSLGVRLDCRKGSCKSGEVEASLEVFDDEGPASVLACPQEAVTGMVVITQGLEELEFDPSTPRDEAAASAEGAKYSGVAEQAAGSSPTPRVTGSTRKRSGARPVG